MKALKHISLIILPIVLFSCSPNRELVSLDEYDDLYYRGDKTPRAMSASTSSDVQVYDDATSAEESYYNNEPYENIDNPPVEEYSDEDYYDADYAGGQNNYYNNTFYNNPGMGGVGYGLGPQVSFGMGYGNVMGMYGRPMWGFGMSYGSPWMNTWNYYDPFYDPFYNPYYGWGRPMWGRPMWGSPWYGGGFGYGYGYPYYGGGFYGGGGFYSGGGFSDGGSTTTYGRRGDNGGRGQRGGITNTGRTSDGTPLLDPTKSRTSERKAGDGTNTRVPENRTRLEQTGTTRDTGTNVRGVDSRSGTDRVNPQTPVRSDQRATPPAPRTPQRNYNTSPNRRAPQGVSPYGRQQQQQRATGVTPQQRSQPRVQPTRGSSTQPPSMNRPSPTRSSSPSFGGSSPSRSGGGVSPSSPSRSGGGSSPSRGGRR